MKLRVCFLTATLFFAANVCIAEEPPIKTEEQLRVTFDELWQVAIDKDLVKKREKPAMSVIHRRKRVPFVGTYHDRIVFYDLFFNYGYQKKISADSYESQRFIVAHEFGHYLLGHADLFVLVVDEESWREEHVRKECEASVFAVLLSGESSGMATLRLWEAARRQTKRERIVSALSLPFFGVKDAISSLVRWRNEIRNPLGRYRRRSWIHGPADQRALLVLEGKRQSCSE